MSKSGLVWNIDDLNDKQLEAVNKGVKVNTIPPIIKKKSKYNAIKTTVDNITFPSKKEARVYSALKCRPGIKFILRQIPFDIPGGYKHRLDFMVVYLDGHIEWVEAKGMDLAMGKLKRRQVEQIYNITIEVL